MPPFEKILFPVDLSDVSRRIIPVVVTVTETFRAELHLLFVARVFRYYDNIYVPSASILEFEEKIIEGARQRLEEFVEEHLARCNVRSTEVVSGDPSEEIIRYVESEGIDLVIMGTHGRKGLDRILFGSVATQVVTRSPVPVLTVNPHRAVPPTRGGDDGDDAPSRVGAA